VKKLIVLVAQVALAVFGGVRESAAQTSTFMYIAGVPGESVEVRYPNWIALNSFGLNLKPGRRGTICEAISVKFPDRSTPALWAAVGAGILYPEVKVALVKGPSRFQYLEVKLINALVSSVTLGTVDPIDETVVMTPQSVIVTYTNQNNDGTPANTTSTVTCGR